MIRPPMPSPRGFVGTLHESARCISAFFSLRRHPPSPTRDDDDSDSDQDDADNNDPESLSASFLSQLRSDPRTPTARYSFDDHHDYFHRLEFEALVQQQQQQQQQPHRHHGFPNPHLAKP